LGERLAPGLPHQQALGTTIRWSLDLLSETDMLVLRQLSAFSGSFTLEAAEQLSAHGPVMSGQVALSLANLVDNSLVQPVRGHDYRYRILIPIRDFCRAELGAAEYRVTRDRHLAYFSDLAKSVGEHADASVLQLELTEILAALEWGFRTGTSEALSLTDVSSKEGERRRADILIGLAAVADALLESDAVQAQAIVPLEEAKTLCDGRMDDARLAAAQALRAAITRKDMATALLALHIVAAIAVQEHDPEARDIVVSVASCRTRAGYSPWHFTFHDCSSWNSDEGLRGHSAGPHSPEIR
jgi:hypothetical protein